MGKAMGNASGKTTRRVRQGTIDRTKEEAKRAVLQPAAPLQGAFPSGELLRYYEAMSRALGPMHWWPAETPFEVIVGAILTQSTGWGNVERAIANLRAARMINPSAM